MALETIASAFQSLATILGAKIDNMIKCIHRLLSAKRASLYILPFCIVSKSLLICFYTYTGRDKIYSLSASYNLLHGKGWTNSFYYMGNLDKEILKPFCYWPPGYGLLITPFQEIFGTNIFLSTAVFEILCFIAFILLCRAILKTQKVTTLWLNISTILLSFFSHDFIESSLGTDLPALTFVLGFFYCGIRIWDGMGTSSLFKYGIVGGICLFFSGFVRYMYIPMSISVISVLLFVSYLKRNRPALRGYFISCLIYVFGFASATFFQQIACGSPFYTGTTDKGIFFENIKYWHPSVIAAFTDLNFLLVQLKKHTSLSLLRWLSVFNWINLLLYGAITTAAVIFLYRHKQKPNPEFPLFVLTGFILSLAVISELVLLSLTHAPQYDFFGNAWTFIVEGRYYAFPVVFIQLSFFTVVARRKGMLSFHTISSAALSFLLLLFFLNSFHQFYYTVKVGSNYKSMKEAVVREQDYRYFESLLQKTIEENPRKEILVASSDSYYPLLASMHHQKGLADPQNLNNQTPLVKRPSLLLTVVPPGQERLFLNYLNKKEVKFIKEVAGSHIYAQSIEPSH